MEGRKGAFRLSFIYESTTIYIYIICPIWHGSDCRDNNPRSGCGSEFLTWFQLWYTRSRYSFVVVILWLLLRTKNVFYPWLVIFYFHSGTLCTYYVGLPGQHIEKPDTRPISVRHPTRSSADADNRLDAFSGQSRSTNMLHIVSYCAIVTLSLSIFVFKKFHDLEMGSKVTQGHWEWYHSVDCVWFPKSY